MPFLWAKRKYRALNRTGLDAFLVTALAWASVQCTNCSTSKSNPYHHIQSLYYKIPNKAQKKHSQMTIQLSFDLKICNTTLEVKSDRWMNREGSHLLIYFPKCPQRLEISQAKSRSQELSPGLSCGWWESSYENHHLLPPRMYISRKWE